MKSIIKFLDEIGQPYNIIEHRISTKVFVGDWLCVERRKYEKGYKYSVNARYLEQDTGKELIYKKIVKLTLDE